MYLSECTWGNVLQDEFSLWYIFAMFVDFIEFSFILCVLMKEGINHFYFFHYYFITHVGVLGGDGRICICRAYINSTVMKYWFVALITSPCLVDYVHLLLLYGTDTTIVTFHVTFFLHHHKNSARDNFLMSHRKFYLWTFKKVHFVKITLQWN